MLFFIEVTESALGSSSLSFDMLFLVNNWHFIFCRTEKSKDQMVVDLAFNTKVLLLGGIVLGSLSVGILGYAVVRYTFLMRSYMVVKLFAQKCFTSLLTLSGLENYRKTLA